VGERVLTGGGTTTVDSLRLVEPPVVGSGGEQALFDRDLYVPPNGPARGATPPVPSIAIRRARLERILDDHPERRVILVRGPAGAGKTVLVAQWVRTHAHPCAWLSIDPTHNDVDLLVRHLVEALNRLTSEPIDRSVARSPVGGGIDHQAVRDLVDAVSHELGRPIVLAIDDVHRLRDPVARQVLGQLVEHPPESVRVVLIARSKPRLGLERARLRSDLVEVTPAALCFDRSEINALAASWTGRLPTAAELEQLTLGWTAGLRLAHLEATSDDALFAGPGEQDAVAREYVREELLEALPEDVGPFLEVSCWLPVLTEPLRAAVTEQHEGHRPWSWRDLEALPIQPVASRPGTFRYPPILSRVVQQEYRRRDPQAAVDACRHAAEACWSTGELVTSIELFLQVDRVDEAIRVCGDLAERGESSLGTIDELLRRRPEVPGEGDHLLPWRIRAAVAAGHADKGRALLEQADRASRPTDRSAQAESREMLTARAVLAESAGDGAGLLAHADELLTLTERTQAPPGSDRQVRHAHGWRIRALVWSGDLVGALAALRAMEEAAGGSMPEAAADLALARAWIAWLGGDVARIAEIVAAARGESHHAERAAELDLLAGSAHRERNQPAKALPLVQQARALAVASAADVVAALAASELARCHRTAGATMEALALVVPARAAHPHLPLAVDAHLRATEVRVRLDRADVAGARGVLEDAPPGADTQLLAARIALHEAPAEAHLEQAQARTSRQAVEKLLLASQLPDIDQAEASATLAAAISAGGHLGLVRTFLDEGPTVRRRLQQLAFETPERTVGRLAALASQEMALGSAPEPTDPIGPLTARELAVLRMLPLRMSNREMAAQMYISVNTLKTHIRAIYRKLDVAHRSAAVNRARALQLV
jgi:LuxR family transcriptional regulator, maltose regulon positive regulatory protein